MEIIDFFIFAALRPRSYSELALSLHGFALCEVYPKLQRSRKRPSGAWIRNSPHESLHIQPTPKTGMVLSNS
jgi:hypothetical protein